uniref:Uncharacterized protein n=1 Tax=Anguilla anguilla TaxID=7936 RepID=A0A0E9URX5_ANGAN
MFVVNCIIFYPEFSKKLVTTLILVARHQKCLYAWHNAKVEKH